MTRAVDNYFPLCKVCSPTFSNLDAVQCSKAFDYAHKILYTGGNAIIIKVFGKLYIDYLTLVYLTIAPVNHQQLSTFFPYKFLQMRLSYNNIDVETISKAFSDLGRSQ